ncbi:MAG: hypothetical protein MJZ67_05620 [Bacteroidales bacterium]|nr:hypothetical protein [Bacteroidales bacterium]
MTSDFRKRYPLSFVPASIWLRSSFDLASFQLRFGFVSSSIWLRSSFDAASMHLRCCFDAPSLVLRCTFDDSSMTLRWASMGFAEEASGSKNDPRSIDFSSFQQRSSFLGGLGQLACGINHSTIARPGQMLLASARVSPLRRLGALGAALALRKVN